MVKKFNLTDWIVNFRKSRNKIFVKKKLYGSNELVFMIDELTGKYYFFISLITKYLIINFIGV